MNSIDKSENQSTFDKIFQQFTEYYKKPVVDEKNKELKFLVTNNY